MGLSNYLGFSFQKLCWVIVLGPFFFLLVIPLVLRILSNGVVDSLFAFLRGYIGVSRLG